MSSRRSFLGQILTGAATLATNGLFPRRGVLGANDRIRICLIGAGGRGREIFQTALRCPNTEAVAVADVYTRRLEEVKRFVPQVQTYTDFRRLLEDKGIDAVLIATPQHQHALNFVPAILAGKDVYQEKTMAFNPDHAKRMRRAFQGSGRVVQIGVQSLSSAAVQQAREHIRSGRLGTLTAKANGAEFEESLGLAIERLLAQARKHHEKISQGRKRLARRESRRRGAGREAGGAETGVFSDGPIVVPMGRVPVKPMSVEEAILLLQEAPDPFLVFRDADSQQVSVIFRRGDGRFGLIEPET